MIDVEKLQAEKLRTQALKSAAHLIAALYDKRLGLKRSDMSVEVKDSAAILLGELDALGLLAPYRDERGKLVIL